MIKTISLTVLNLNFGSVPLLVSVLSAAIFIGLADWRPFLGGGGGGG